MTGEFWRFDTPPCPDCAHPPHGSRCRRQVTQGGFPSITHLCRCTTQAPSDKTTAEWQAEARWAHRNVGGFCPTCRTVATDEPRPWPCPASRALGGAA